MAIKYTKYILMQYKRLTEITEEFGKKQIGEDTQEMS